MYSATEKKVFIYPVDYDSQYFKTMTFDFVFPGLHTFNVVDIIVTFQTMELHLSFIFSTYSQQGGKEVWKGIEFHISQIVSLWKYVGIIYLIFSK